MSFSTVLLDWDGCLADTLSVWMQSYLNVYKRYGFSVTPTQVIEKSWGNTDQGPLNIGIADNKACWKEIVELVREGVTRVPLHEYTKELLQKLQEAHIHVAIVTSSEKRVVIPALKFHGLEKHIDLLVTDNDVSKPKPDPEIIFAVLEHFSSDKKSSIIIGDTQKDILAGKNAGISTGLVLHKTNSTYYDFETLKQSNPDHVFSSLREVAALTTPL